MQVHRKLDNLVVIVDNNNLQIDGTIDEVNSPYPIDKKFEAFNFHVITYQMEMILIRLQQLLKRQERQRECRQQSLQRQ